LKRLNSVKDSSERINKGREQEIKRTIKGIWELVRREISSSSLGRCREIRDWVYWGNEKEYNRIKFSERE